MNALRIEAVVVVGAGTGIACAHHRAQAAVELDASPRAAVEALG